MNLLYLSFIKIGCRTFFYYIKHKVIFFRFIPSELLQNLVIKPVVMFIKNGTEFISIFQILFGYFLVTSFYKQKQAIKEEITVLDHNEAS